MSELYRNLFFSRYYRRNFKRRILAECNASRSNIIKLLHISFCFCKRNPACNSVNKLCRFKSFYNIRNLNTNCKRFYKIMNCSFVSFCKVITGFLKLCNFSFNLLFLISKAFKNIFRHTLKILWNFKSNKSKLFKFNINLSTVLFRRGNKHMRFIFAKSNYNCHYRKT